jgi:hypothetical protein
MCSMIISQWILLRMKNVLDNSRRENQNTHIIFNKFFLQKSRHFWHSVEETQNALLVFHYNNCYMNTPQCYSIRTLPVLFVCVCVCACMWRIDTKWYLASCLSVVLRFTFSKKIIPSQAVLWHAAVKESQSRVKSICVILFLIL